MFIALKWSGDIERTFQGHRKWGVQIGVDIHFNYFLKNFIGCVDCMLFLLLLLWSYYRFTRHCLVRTLGQLFDISQIVWGYI